MQDIISHPHKLKVPTRVLSCDLLLVDESIKPEQGTDVFDKCASVLSNMGLSWGGKKPIDENEKKKFGELFANSGLPRTRQPGGSSANTLAMLSEFLGPTKVKVDFLGVCGPEHPDDPEHPDSLIRASLRKANITLHEPPANGVKPESAYSYIVNPKGLDRTSATYPGTFDQCIKPYMISDALVNNSDVILMQGSLWHKLGETLPVENGHAPDHQLGVADTLMKKRWEMGKELWLTMPTQADFSKKTKIVDGKEVKLTIEERETQHNNKAAHFRHLVESANVVMGNGEEISRVYTYPHERAEIKQKLREAGIDTDALKDRSDLVKKLGKDRIAELNGDHYDIINNSVHIDVALKRLNEALQKETLKLKCDPKNIAQGETRWKGDTSQVAFVSLGKEGSVVVTKEKDGVGKKVPVAELDEKEILNRIGAGDTSYAGFLAGYMEKKQNPQISYDDCANLGMWLAREKLKVDGPRIPNPYKAFIKAIEDTTQAREEEAGFVKIMKQIMGAARDQIGDYATFAWRMSKLNAKDDVEINSKLDEKIKPREEIKPRDEMGNATFGHYF